MYQHDQPLDVVVAQGCGKGCDNMSAVVVVLKQFSPFTKLEHEINLNQLPPPPSLDDFSPEFHGAPLLHFAACTTTSAGVAALFSCRAAVTGSTAMPYHLSFLQQCVSRKREGIRVCAMGCLRSGRQRRKACSTIA